MTPFNVGDRFELVQPERPVLDPWAWTEHHAAWIGATHPMVATIEALVAWARFCYWAAEWNLAARILPTHAEPRTRASNGRAVPVAELAVMLPAWTVQAWAGDDWSIAFGRDDMAAACRRALDGAP